MCRRINDVNLDRMNYRRS